MDKQKLSHGCNVNHTSHMYNNSAALHLAISKVEKKYEIISLLAIVWSYQ